VIAHCSSEGVWVQQAFFLCRFGDSKHTTPPFSSKAGIAEASERKDAAWAGYGDRWKQQMQGRTR